jgi:hypothetical protein
VCGSPQTPARASGTLDVTNDLRVLPMHRDITIDKTGQQFHDRPAAVMV